MSKTLKRASVCAVAAMISVLTGQTLFAQSSTGTGSGTDALGIFQGLSADQQQQILQRLGGSGGTGASTGSTSTGTPNSQSQSNDQQQTQRRTRRDEDREQDQDQGQEANGGPPVFKGLDSVVVEVDMHPLKPRQVDTFSAVAASSYSAQLQMQQTQQLAQAQLQQFRNDAQLQAQTQAPQAADDTSQLTDQQKGRLQKLILLLRSKNPYQLSREGVLTLPGLSGIPLGGLTEMQATLRLEVDPMLQDLHFRITRLPLRKTGLEGLKPFGYDLFERDPSTFSPVTNVPVPADYTLGPVINSKCSCTAIRTATLP